MMRRLLVTLGLVIVVAIGFAFRAWSDPKSREVRRIEKRLLGLASGLSFTEKGSPFQRLAYGDRVADFFADTTELDIAVGSREIQVTLSRGELRDRALATRATAKGLSVQFMDVVVTLNERMDEATAHLTSKIYFTGEPDYWVQEFRLQLGKVHPEGWRIRKITTIKTME